MFTSILVAYDGSDHATKALETAAGLAKLTGAKLHLSHVPQVDTPPIVIGSFVAALDSPPTDAQIEEAGHAIVEKAKAEAKALGVAFETVHLGAVEPARVILNAAEKAEADLIVMGRRGLGSFGALTLGSVSGAVAHGATCACMTVF